MHTVGMLRDGEKVNTERFCQPVNMRRKTGPCIFLFTYHESVPQQARLPAQPFVIVFLLLLSFYLHTCDLFLFCHF